MSVSNAADRERLGLRLIGGRYAFSWISLTATLPLITLGFVATEMPSGDGSRWWAYALVAVVSQVAPAVVFGLATWLIPRPADTGQISPWVVITVYFVAGQARLALLLLGIDVLELFSGPPLWARVITSGILFPLFFALSSYSLEALARYRDQRGELIHTITEATVELDQQRLAAAALHDQVVGQAERDIAQANATVSQWHDPIF